MNTRIYHNPRCSKSRETLALIEDKGISPEIILYLETPPSRDELKEILIKLKLTARDIIRSGEQIYKELDLGDEKLDDNVLITAMVKHPILIERPIVVKGKYAKLARPPEKVLEIL